MDRLQEKYLKEVVPAMTEKFGYKNIMELPKVEKIIINMGVGEAVGNPKALDAAVADMTLISGQKPLLTRAKKSLAAWKLREGMPIGCMVTLRRDRMYEFLDRLMNVSLARVRDFKGVSGKAFDGQGNYTLGIKEQLIFREINYDEIDKIKGLNVTIVTSAKNDEEGKALLKHMGMPFRN